jgi:hypothetical protein
LENFAVSTSQPAWILAIIEAYQQDATAQQLLQRLSICSESDDTFSLHDGVIRKQGRIWLPPKTELHQHIIREMHATPLGGHSGIPVTLRKLK